MHIKLMTNIFFLPIEIIIFNWSSVFSHSLRLMFELPCPVAGVEPEVGGPVVLAIDLGTAVEAEADLERSIDSAGRNIAGSGMAGLIWSLGCFVELVPAAVAASDSSTVDLLGSPNYFDPIFLPWREDKPLLRTPQPTKRRFSNFRELKITNINQLIVTTMLYKPLR